MRHVTIVLSALFLLHGIAHSPSALAQQQDTPAMLGFSSANAKIEADLEKRFAAIPDPQRMRANMKLLSARPHHVGSPYDKQNAEWILAQYKKWGWDAHIETFQVLFPAPKTRLFEMGNFRAKLDEPAIAVDPTSDQKDEQLPTYNAYSPDGDVTAPLVYVNYGLIEDYKQLARYGISVKGAIVIARYGASWRGIKPKIAAEHGAVGCILYSDPADDGYAVNQVFPDGPTRPAEGVQRGSVLDAPSYPGDPLTPGIGATADAKRLKREDAPSLPKIPVTPVSYQDAQPLLAALQGPPVPANWRGGLPITYRIGPSSTKVHLKLAFNWDLKPVYDVVATMHGSEEPDVWVLRGNHHDAWVNGADDPISGQVALLEEARAIGQLAATGWKPKRTIMYFSWDGEEPMLLGSTEWAEQHAAELRKHAAVYINSDGNERGYLAAQGSHSLEPLVNQVARSVTDPETNVSAWQRLRAQELLHGTPEARKEASTRSDLRIGPLGTGSDFTAFIDHLGVASLNVSYGGEDNGAGVYHSIYDDFYWYSHFADSTYVYGRALAQTDGALVLRMAQADVLPYDFAALADTLHIYEREVKDLLAARQKEAKERTAALQMNAYALTSDPKHPMIAPPPLAMPPYLNFAPIDNALASLDKSAADFNEARTRALSGSIVPERLGEINEELTQAARKLTNPQGLPRRPWMQNLIYAPGWYTGYDAKTLPGVREAIEQNRYDEASEQIVLVGHAIDDEAAFVERVAT
ncbi:MAG TPA: transferrin receptor-like dimerization domain-containing protein, partial [Acidobacteriaceae bacterium]|nr:transferrin receptor-like dimerization domain-containing protein [Acidobacteriaceae bacterium]